MMRYQYYATLDDDRILLFDVDTCEKCGCRVEAPNAVNGARKDIPKWRRAGTQPWYMPLPPESGYCEVLGMAVCPDCYVEAPGDTPSDAGEIAQEKAAKLGWREIATRLASLLGGVKAAWDGPCPDESKRAMIGAMMVEAGPALDEYTRMYDAELVGKDGA